MAWPPIEAVIVFSFWPAFFAWCLWCKYRPRREEGRGFEVITREDE